jgi:hypothetical protein
VVSDLDIICTCIRDNLNATSNLFDAMAIAKKEKNGSTTQVKEEKRTRGKQRAVQSDGEEEEGDNEAPNNIADVNDPDEDAQGEEEELEDEEEQIRVSKRQRVNGEGDSRASSVQEQDIPRTRIKTLPRDTDGYLFSH